MTTTRVRNRRNPVYGEALTAREVEVLQALADGDANTEWTAKSLYMSRRTLRNHLCSVYTKLGVTNMTCAVVTAIRLGLVKL